ncbi:hypothetical protein D9M68_999080 [compost metagenome]
MERANAHLKELCFSSCVFYEAWMYILQGENGIAIPVIDITFYPDERSVCQPMFNFYY